ncbi:hypothetical protein N8500_01355 [Candidatus Puniceispirillum sp.]|nr:hypothetical protein [Candidatus Puniceispirillum sp.]
MPNFKVVNLAFDTSLMNSSLFRTFYSVDKSPAPFDVIASLNPVFYTIDGFRFGMIGVADRPLLIGFYRLLVVNIVLAIFCYKALHSGYRFKS